MNRLAVIIHGYEIFHANHPIVKLLESNGYSVEFPLWFEYGKEFNIDQVSQNIINQFKGKEIDLIVGISMGGMISGRVLKALNPKKLILIASGPHFKPSEMAAKKIMNLNKSLLVPSLILLKVTAFIYSLFDKRFKTSSDIINVFFDTRIIKKLSIRYYISLVEYIKREDVSQQFKDFNGQIYSFSGKNDSLMPYENLESFENIKKYLIHSKHSHVINDKSIAIIRNLIR